MMLHGLCFIHNTAYSPGDQPTTTSPQIKAVLAAAMIVGRIEEVLLQQSRVGYSRFGVISF